MHLGEEDEANAMDRIVDLKTGETVGLLYQWTDGAKQPLWFDGEKLDTVLEPIQNTNS